MPPSQTVVAEMIVNDTDIDSQVWFCENPLSSNEGLLSVLGSFSGPSFHWVALLSLFADMIRLYRQWPPNVGSTDHLRDVSPDAFPILVLRCHKPCHVWSRF